MSHFGVSVGELLSKLNALVGGRLLLQVQLQYAWSTQHELEQHVCLLVDSQVKGYTCARPNWTARRTDRCNL
jgi:hypothetical protein